MSRSLVGKVRVRGELVARSPISVGGMGAGEHVDLDVAVDGSGNFYIPGTSLAGPMRAWLMEHLASEKLVSNLFGYIDSESDAGKASLLHVEDSPVSQAMRERRHGIGLREDSGTVADGLFYSRGLLPRGTRFPLDMELDVSDKTPKAESEHPVGALVLLLDALHRGEVRFGACKTQGMGELCLEGLEVDYYDFAGDPGALDCWLNGDNASQRGLEVLERFGTPELKAKSNFGIVIAWRARSPVMVKAGRDGAETDMLPLMSGVERAEGEGKKIAPVIPGSSLKGALRSQARRILHTLFDPTGERVEEAPKYLAILDILFGSPERAGRLSVGDVYYRWSVLSNDWLEEQQEVLNFITDRCQHVAIDRFTGGASDGALYSVRPVKRDVSGQEGGSSGWEPIRLSLNLSGISETEVQAILALMKLLIRDLEDGYIPIGFASRRGLGDIAVDNVDYKGFPKDEDLQNAWDSFVETGGAFGTQQEETNGNV